MKKKTAVKELKKDIEKKGVKKVAKMLGASPMAKKGAKAVMMMKKGGKGKASTCAADE